MADRNGIVQRAPLPPLNSPRLAEGDRAGVYALIGKELNNVLNGSSSYHPDGMKKSSRDLKLELDSFIDGIDKMKDAVDDPANIFPDAVQHLDAFRKAFKSGVANDIETMWNEWKDTRDNSIKLPDNLTPTTRDHSVIYIDPDSVGPFSMPNPLLPKNWPKELKASNRSSDEVASNGSSPDIYGRPPVRMISSALGSGRPPVPVNPLAVSGTNSTGLAGRLAPLAGIDPNDPDQTALPAGGLLGLWLRGQAANQ